MSGTHGTDGSEHENDDVRPAEPDSRGSSAGEADSSSAPTEQFAAFSAPRVPETPREEPADPGTEPPEPEKPHSGTPQPETAKLETARPETPRAETARPETARPETARPETDPSEAATAVIPVVTQSGREDASTARIHRSSDASSAKPAGSTPLPSSAPDSRNAPPPASPPTPPPGSPPPVAPPPGGNSGSSGDGSGSWWSGVPKRTVALVVGGVVALLAVLYVADLAVSSGKVPRGVTVAGIEIGGESLDEAEAHLRQVLSERLDEPVPVVAGETSGEIVPAQAGIGIDWDATLDRVGSQPLNPFTRLASFFGDEEIGVVSTRDDATLAVAIDEFTAAAAYSPREGNIVFEGGTPVPVTPQPGQRVDVATASDVFAERWAFGEVSLPVEQVDVTVTREGLDRALADIAVPAVSADLVVRGKDGTPATLARDQIGAVLSFVPDGKGGLTPEYHPEAAVEILAPQLRPTETEPRDARIEIQGGRPAVVPGVKGELVDWAKTLETFPELLAVTDDRVVEAVYQTVDPALTTEAAEKLGINEVIGEYTTGGFEYASGVNIRLAAAEINGAVLKPGETFSLNGYTGPRGAAEGYVESGIIEAGRPGKAVGGGISQLATTLYNASYFAGMEDVAHTEHSYYISRYPAAREATVFEGAIDLQFRNPFETGVLIQTITTGSDVTVRLWGTKTVDVQSITGERTNFTTPNTITLPAGPGCIASSGAQGFTVSDTRVVTDAKTGAQISNTTRTVRYDPVPIVKCVEPDDKDGADSEGDQGAGGDAPAPASPAPAPASSTPASAPAGEAPAQAPAEGTASDAADPIAEPEAAAPARRQPESVTAPGN
ncbi:VanW family protein [Rhodococcus sp. (in: high G+C Gram-positive bacteria)]|uniref:VanW family protein n=1 Tax=Rhodococcus sp. TaxID=1831 RepID=UPI0019E58C60|nr:VanW family protein [Rhodococcus sp. (in: high G+C Gram-positive bacteria)]MBF0661227.1 VanW family protein [Rhodococcus sp. (in: high G+C Gram-positive bacteria)]